MWSWCEHFAVRSAQSTVGSIEALKHGLGVGHAEKTACRWRCGREVRAVQYVRFAHWWRVVVEELVVVKELQVCKAFLHRELTCKVHAADEVAHSELVVEAQATFEHGYV